MLNSKVPFYDFQSINATCIYKNKGSVFINKACIYKNETCILSMQITEKKFTIGQKQVYS
ncbi:hypothetical protein D7Y07_08965 [Bacteroides acidifaciens]|uniref:Uncharacterized protein n=1 Tax=Bacteroides acidifaciens TaxID=85831 RepID=A0A3L7Z1J2_9BACE|nr:hypothetical protein D7Y07_08965 [Bacteroides acidifaciens]